MILCKKCNQELLPVTRLENFITNHVTKSFICKNPDCMNVEIVYSDRREATDKEREIVLNEYVGVLG